MNTHTSIITIIFWFILYYQEKYPFRFMYSRWVKQILPSLVNTEAKKGKPCVFPYKPTDGPWHSCKLSTLTTLWALKLSRSCVYHWHWKEIKFNNVAWLLHFQSFRGDFGSLKRFPSHCLWIEMQSHRLHRLKFELEFQVIISWVLNRASSESVIPVKTRSMKLAF